MNIRLCILINVNSGLSIPTDPRRLVHKGFPWNNFELPKSGLTLNLAYVKGDDVVMHRIFVDNEPEYTVSYKLSGPWILANPRIFGIVHFNDTDSADVFETDLLHRGFDLGE